MILFLASSPTAFFSLAGVSAFLLYANKEAIMEGRDLWHLENDLKKARRQSPLSFTLFEFGKRDVTLRQMYEEKNEEYYRQLKTKQASEV